MGLEWAQLFSLIVDRVPIEMGSTQHVVSMRETFVVQNNSNSNHPFLFCL